MESIKDCARILFLIGNRLCLCVLNEANRYRELYDHSFQGGFRPRSSLNQ